ncbi:hypothetical protein BKA61DRAFT_735372 [Leptodontidium sp. MPI-SDFR-AT-0119]|nr:hypothetical protein BKA61DRAFT_735372 [Leptodontidium sp. MPI-SDFR-AT-0119]
MDAYSSSYNTDDQDDEPYHCNPAYDEEEIVCLGSDAEETTGEIAKKHQRYEAEARRCAKGYLPVLQSASLRGPFETGWVNPWRSRPTKKQNEDWWQPGSEDMLFTRAKVMERAAAHGLGYLQPADALRWCKATAQAEAEIINETNIQSGQIMRSVERDDQDDYEDAEGTLEVGGSDQLHTRYRPDYSDSARSMERPELSMLNHYSKTPNMDEPGNSMKVTKRPADYQWLKGSYVSKRARWEGPAVPSPTPLPDVLERDRRRRQLSARTVGHGKVKPHHLSRLSRSFPDVTPKKLPKHLIASVRDPVNPRDFAEQSDPGAISTVGLDGRTSQLRREDFGHQPDDFDELQDNSQEYFSWAAPQSSVKSKKIRVSIHDRSFSDLEPDDLVVITPRSKPKTATKLTKTQSSDSQMSNAGPEESYDLPELPCRYMVSHEQNGGDLENEDSFITEVAPSSRNLEKFEFRKRRPKLSGPWNNRPIPELDANRRSVGSDAQSQRPNGQYRLSDNTLDERPLVSSQATPPKSDRSVASWDMIEDITQISSSRCAAKAAQTTSPPKSTSSTSASPFTTPKKGSARSLVSSHTSHLLFNSPRKQSKLQMGAGENLLPLGSNDMSTQAFNTTPPRSMLSTTLQTLPLLSEAVTRHPKTETSLETLKTTEMDRIQLALSQTCPSSSRGDSSHESPERDLQEGLIRHGLSSKGRISDRHVRRSHGTAGSPVVRPHSQERRAPGLPDIEFTEFANESFLFLGGYLSEEPVWPGAATTIEVESEVIPRAVTLEHQSQISFDGLRQEENASAEHARIALESIQVRKEIAPSAAFLLEPESRRTADPTTPVVQDEVESEGNDRSSIHTPISDEGDHGSEVVPLEPSSTPSEPKASDDSTSVEIDEEAGLEGDDWRLDRTQMHQETTQVNDGLASRPIGILERQNELSMDAEIQTVQDEANEEVGGKNYTESSDMSEQANEESHFKHYIIVDAMGGIEPDAQSNDPATGSEASWEGCGPQSPWATERIEPLATYLSRKQVENGSPLPKRHEQAGGSSKESIEQDNGIPIEETSWITMERPHTPDDNYIKPFKDFSTPKSSPERQYTDLGGKSMDTQSLVDAMRNPWTGNSKTRSSGKARKRVSFGTVPLNEEENSQREKIRGPNATPRSPPPAQPEESSQDEDIFHDGATVPTTFSKHFVAASRRRQFKRILPEIRSSQLNSSPALLGAQAEAFMAADHEIPADKLPSSAKATPSRYLKTRNDTNSNTNIWNEIGEDDTMLSHSFSRCPTEKASGGQTSLTGFDMASALGEAGNFLEDWSVDAVLKKPVDTEPSKRVESNGMRRRRLFGLV